MTDFEGSTRLRKEHPESRLEQILKRQQLSVPGLHRRIRDSGLQANLKSRYRLGHAKRPVERLDVRVAGATPPRTSG